MARIRNFFNDETGSEMSQHATTAALAVTFCIVTFIALSGGYAAALQSLREIVLGR